MIDWPPQTNYPCGDELCACCVVQHFFDDCQIYKQYAVDGELILSAINEVMNTVLLKLAFDII